VGSGNENLTKLLNTILNSFIDLCRCDAGSIYTLRRDAQKQPVLVFEAMSTRSMKLFQVPDALKNMRFKLDESTLVGKTAVTRTFHRAKFDVETASARPGAFSNYVTRNILSAPLLSPRGDLVGVVQLLNKLPYDREPQPGDDPATYPEFDTRDERLMSIVAGQAALAIENSLLLEEQEHLLDGFVNAFVTAVEARDPVTSGHSTRVSDYSVALGEAVNRVGSGTLAQTKFNDKQLREIRFAAMLHDIGKISVKEDVLNKEKKLLPWQLEVIRMRLRLMKSELRLRSRLTGEDFAPVIGTLERAFGLVSEANEPAVLPASVNHLIRDLTGLEITAEDGSKMRALTEDEGFKLSILKGSLTPDERTEIERHVTHTYEILKLVPWSRGLEAVPDIAWKHHEKLDGTGYPRGIQAKEIPVQSRMLTICDIYDALTADDRPYKRSLPLDKALGILESEVKHTKLDGELFKVFVDARIYEAAKSRKKAKAA
jgi:HD-GYP domain-containing protein (c-di-GMP phosphodiesterase class II)